MPARTRLAAGLAVALAAAGRAPAARAQSSATPTGGAATGALRGTVYDSLGRAPLAGAVVQAVQRDARAVAYSATTDSAGAFRLDTLPPGTYLIGFLHPLLDVLGVEVTPRTVTVAAGALTPIALGVPGPATLRTALCGTGAAANDSTGLLVGTVRDADRDEAVPNATVVLTWSEFVFDQRGFRTERRRVPVTVTPVGSYAACGVPTDGPLVASAQAPGRESGLVEVEIGRTRFLRRDFVLGDSTPTPTPTPVAAGASPSTATADSAPSRPAVRRGTARLVGFVRDPNGRAVRGARVQVWGTGAAGTTGEDGRFALDSLPTGTHTVEARAIGFAPRTAPVDLTPRRLATVELAMAKPATTLGRVTVYGKRSRASRWEDEFLERRKGGFGKFFTAADIDQAHPIYTTDMLRRAVGVRVYPGLAGGSAVRLRGDCIPVVILDGTPVYDGANDIDQLVPPQQLAGIEVYTGLAGVPVQYTGILGTTGCGAVLLWTKR